MTAATALNVAAVHVGSRDESYVDTRLEAASVLPVSVMPPVEYPGAAPETSFACGVVQNSSVAWFGRTVTSAILIVSDNQSQFGDVPAPVPPVASWRK